MAIPSQKDIHVPLLHLIYAIGGEAKPRDVCDRLADFFKLTENERNETLPSGLNKKFNHRVYLARYSLCSQGFLDGTSHGVWRITEEGIKEISRLVLAGEPSKGQDLSRSKCENEKESEDEMILELVLEEIAPDGPQKFPDHFLDDDRTDLDEIELPGTQLCLAPKTKTIITSPSGYFKYTAKNPVEAKYILYAHHKGLKQVKIPKNNFTLFRVVKSYERYCNDIMKRTFELFLEFTYDEHKAESLTTELMKRLDLRFKIEQD